MNTYFELGKTHFYIRFIELSFNTSINNDHTSSKRRKTKLHVSAVRPASGVSPIHMQAIKASIPREEGYSTSTVVLRVLGDEKRTRCLGV
jgi:hypothetical protein